MASEVSALRRDNPVVQLEEKFRGWVVQQPEWLLIVNMPRQQRRAAMRELANRLYTIPVMDGVNTVNRQVRRDIKKKLARAAVQGVMTEEIAQAVATVVAQEEGVALSEAAASVSLDKNEDGSSMTQSVESATFEGSEPSAPEAVVEEPVLDPEGEVKATIQEGIDASE